MSHDAEFVLDFLLNAGAAALMVLVLWMVFSYLKNREGHEHEEHKEQTKQQSALADSISTLATTFSEYLNANVKTLEKTTETLEKIGDGVKANYTGIDNVISYLNRTSETMSKVVEQRDRQYKEILTAVNDVPQQVQTLMRNDLEAIGVRLGGLVDQTEKMHNDVKDALAEWVQVSGWVKRVLNDSEGSKAAIVEEEKKDGGEAVLQE